MDKMERAGKGKHYEVYTEYGTPSKSYLSKQGMLLAGKFDAHQSNVLYIPGKFSLETHGWGDVNVTPTLPVIKKFVFAHIDDTSLESKLGGKWHFDLRIAKMVNGHLNQTWFGYTIFKQPWHGTVEDKRRGTTKGYNRLTDLGEQLRNKSGVAKMELGNEMKWMVNESTIPIGAEGNPTSQWPSWMILIERLQPCVIHRRQIDFADITFLGKYLRGRYYIRLVSRKLQESEKPKYMQGKEMKDMEVFFWKAKDQFDEKTMLAVASGKMRVAPTGAPASHDKKVKLTEGLLQ